MPLTPFALISHDEQVIPAAPMSWIPTTAPEPTSTPAPGPSATGCADGQVDINTASLEELKTTHWHLKKIQEILPLCMGCGKIKTGSASWTSLVDYLRENEIFVSHGYCPSCAEEYARRHGLADELP